MTYNDRLLGRTIQNSKEEKPSATVVDNPVVGRILGPDGKTLSLFRERREVPFGFQRSDTK